MSTFTFWEPFSSWVSICDKTFENDIKGKAALYSPDGWWAGIAALLTGMTVGFVWLKSRYNRSNFIVSGPIDVGLIVPFIYVVLAGTIARLPDSGYDPRVLVKPQNNCYQAIYVNEFHLTCVWWIQFCIMLASTVYWLYIDLTRGYAQDQQIASWELEKMPSLQFLFLSVINPTILQVIFLSPSMAPMLALTSLKFTLQDWQVLVFILAAVLYSLWYLLIQFEESPYERVSIDVARSTK